MAIKLKKKDKIQEELDKAYNEAEADSHKWYGEKKWEEALEEETPSKPSNFQRGRTIEDGKAKPQLAPIYMKDVYPKGRDMKADEVKTERKLKLKKAGVTFKDDKKPVKRKMTEGQVKEVKNPKLKIKRKKDTNNTKLKLWMH